jgi:hypothetical protein
MPQSSSRPKVLSKDRGHGGVLPWDSLLASPRLVGGPRGERRQPRSTPRFCRSFSPGTTVSGSDENLLSRSCRSPTRRAIHLPIFSVCKTRNMTNHPRSPHFRVPVSLMSLKLCVISCSDAMVPIPKNKTQHEARFRSWPQQVKAINRASFDYFSGSG